MRLPKPHRQLKRTNTNVIPAKAGTKYQRRADKSGPAKAAGKAGDDVVLCCS